MHLQKANADAYLLRDTDHKDTTIHKNFKNNLNSDS
jgi:hypothetical protein